MISLIRQLVLTGVLLVVSIQALVAQGLPRTRPEEVGMSAHRLERLTDVLQGYVD